MHESETTPDLVDMLVSQGLVQFGQFIDREGQSVPIRLNLHMLPAYPSVLRVLSSAVSDRVVRTPADRLVCGPESLPLALPVSLQTNIPLVYSRGRGEAAALDLVGAYDVGHPAVLIINSIDDVKSVSDLISNAARVGLVIRTIITVTALRDIAFSGINIHSLIVLESMLDRLVKTNRLPEGQAGLVRRYAGEG